MKLQAESSPFSLSFLQSKRGKTVRRCHPETWQLSQYGLQASAVGGPVAHRAALSQRCWGQRDSPRKEGGPSAGK